MLTSICSSELELLFRYIIIITIELMFAGMHINMFLAQPRLSVARGVLRRAKNIFMPKNINCITIILILKDNYRIKN